MKRCTSCFRYSLGDPPFCSHCGRSYNVRLCPRGHRNPRGAQYCADCGSGDLSTPGAPAGWLFHLSAWTLRALVPTLVVLMAAGIALAVWWSVDWAAIASRVVLLVLAVLALYWTTTLLPGPVRKVGKAAGRAAWKAATKPRKRQ